MMIEINNIGDQLEMITEENQFPTGKKNGEVEVKISLWSGRKCTHSGEWEVEGKISTVAYLSKGDLMPTYCEKNVKWILLRKG